MAEAPLSLDIEYFPDPTRGRPVFNGSVYVGVPDTDPEILANRVNVVAVQENGVRVNIPPSQQPLLTGAGGVVLYQGSPVVILVGDTVSVKVLDNLGQQVYYVPFANETAEVNVNEGVLIPNGSFENDSQFSGIPDNWTLQPGANGFIQLDGLNSAHGLKSLKFTSTDATGGGTATTLEKFNVLENDKLDIRFSYESSAVDTLNKVQVVWYDASSSVISTTDVLNEGAANPLTWTGYIISVTAPANAVQAELVLTGVDGAGTTVIGTTSFDDVSADFNKYAVLDVAAFGTIEPNKAVITDASGYISAITNTLEFRFNFLNSNGSAAFRGETSGDVGLRDLTNARDAWKYDISANNLILGNNAGTVDIPVTAITSGTKTVPIIASGTLSFSAVAAGAIFSNTVAHGLGTIGQNEKVMFGASVAGTINERNIVCYMRAGRLVSGEREILVQAPLGAAAFTAVNAVGDDSIGIVGRNDDALAQTIEVVWWIAKLQ